MKSALSEVEFIRIWAHEVPEYEAQGWRLSRVTRGKPCEAILGPDYADCLMVRTHPPLLTRDAAYGDRNRGENDDA